MSDLQQRLCKHYAQVADQRGFHTVWIEHHHFHARATKDRTGIFRFKDDHVEVEWHDTVIALDGYYGLILYADPDFEKKLFDFLDQLAKVEPGRMLTWEEGAHNESTNTLE